MSVSQSTFLGALQDPNQPVPQGLTDPEGRPAGRRFDVYRNNVASSLADALETGFPVVAKLVGRDFFRAMAGAFWRAHPPSTPVLMLYGEDFPAFLSNFPPVAHLPYLADVARLEFALRKSYHAADAPPFDPQVLASADSETLMEMRLCVAPATMVIVSRYPIYDIWLANTQADAPKPGKDAQCVLITRAEFDPQPQPVTNGTAAFLDALKNDQTFGEAIAAAEAATTEFDLNTTLALLLASSALTTQPEP